MEIFKVSDPKEAIAFAQRCLAEGKEGLDLFYNTDIFVQTGITHTADLDKARELGLPIWRAEHLGGTIICFPGDLSMCLVTWGNSMPDFGERSMEAVAELLEERGAVVTYDNNDVLADGKKVASWARATLVSGFVQTVLHFSVNVDLELIKEICIKTMEKVPGALSDYGITADMIWQRIKKKTGIGERK